MPDPIQGAIFFNPASGARDPAIAKALRAAAAENRLQVYDVAPGFDVSATIRAAVQRGEKLFLAAGGDGTINHVLQAVAHNEATLGIIPLGTFNHLAKDLKIPLDWRAALDVALTGATAQIDLGRINDRFFANNISLGIYPEMAAKRERYRMHGKFRAYREALLWAMRDFPHVTIAIESPPHFKQIKTHVFMVAVNSYDLTRVGVLAPRPTMEGGALSVYWMPHMARIRFVKAVAQFLRGKISIVDGLRYLRTKQLKIDSTKERIRVGMDGEIFAFAPPLVVTIAPSALLVKVPR